ncbi:hypothetical protein DL93DRAFT_2133264 [Clavulina sp. PMI_390]|nr:hypothetical protein DL93DRAFT_2133264 [Clavulina sp. PMI_390]
MSSSKSKSTSVSSGGLHNLKAELAKKKEEFNARRAATGSYKASEFKRPEKKVSQWARQNKGINSRNARDIELEEVSKPTIENARAALERKAALYEKLRKGKTGGLSEKQYDSLLVDFDAQEYNDDAFSSDSDDVDESASVPQRPRDEEDDPMVEYEDEFGRIRTAKKSEVPRHLVKKDEDEYTNDDEVDPHAIYGEQGHFPVYVPSEERMSEIEEAYAEATKDPTAHYDASRENRTTGAGFFQFSADEATRARQMEELKRVREETENARKDAGLDEDSAAPAMDPMEALARLAKGKGKETETESDAASSAPKITGRGIDKRKRELEERRKALDAKRRKTGQNNTVSSDAPPAAQQNPADPSPGLTTNTQPSTSPSSATSSRKRDKTKKSAAPADAADDFLAQLEADLRRS